MTPATGKVTKAAADYGSGMKSAHCGICRHFNAKAKTCAIVAGSIDPDAWCKHFKKGAPMTDTTAGQNMAKVSMGKLSGASRERLPASGISAPRVPKAS